MIRGHVEGGGIGDEDTPTGSIEDYEKACEWAFNLITQTAEKYKQKHQPQS